MFFVSICSLNLDMNYDFAFVVCVSYFCNCVVSPFRLISSVFEVFRNLDFPRLDFHIREFRDPCEIVKHSIFIQL